MLNHLSIRLQYFSELPIQIEYRLVVIQFFLGKIQCDFFLWFSAGIVWRGLSLRWRPHRYSKLISGSLGPIADSRICRSSQSWEKCIFSNVGLASSISPMVCGHMLHTQICKAGRSSATYPTIMLMELEVSWSWTVTDWLDIRPFAPPLPKITAWVLHVGALSSLVLEWFSSSVRWHYFALGCKE